jgi:hypothetical protein
MDPLWQCPRCGHRFVTKNLWHSCVRVRLDEHFRGKPADRRKTWSQWVAAARACGPVTVYAQKTRIVIQARVRFAGAVVRVGYLDAGLWLRRRVEHPRLRRVEDFGPLGYVYHFRLERPSDIDGSLQTLMQEAYRVGTQQLTRRNASLHASGP